MAAAASTQLHLGKGSPDRFPRRQLLGARSRRAHLRAAQPRSAGRDRAARRHDRRAARSPGPEGRARATTCLRSRPTTASRDIPEQAASAAARPMRQATAAIDKALAPILGPGKYVAVNAAYTDIYLEKPASRSAEGRPGAASAVLNALRGTAGDRPRVHGRRDPRRRRRAPRPIRSNARWRSATIAGRSGDLIIVPQGELDPVASATTHGTLYPYDQRVPVIFYGAGVKEGSYEGLRRRPISHPPWPRLRVFRSTPTTATNTATPS